MTDYGGLIEGVGSAIVSVLGLTRTFNFVKEGELGIKLRFGKAKRDKNGEPQIIPPGFVMMIPWVDKLEKHHVRQQTIRLDSQKIMIRDGLIFNINAAIIFRVNDIYRALFEIDGLNTSIADLSMGILRDVLTGRDHTNLNQTKEISALLLDELKEKAQEWGVDFLQFNIIDCAPAPETAQIIIAKAGVMMKAEALEELAKKRGIYVEQLNPTLAAVLVGVPLVASISPEPGIGEKNSRAAAASDASDE
jgi:regulator of protease activity HflC (stomatin/prohibitin superfamily)